MTKKKSDLVDTYKKALTKEAVQRVLMELNLDPKISSNYLKCICPNCESENRTGYIYPLKCDIIWCKSCQKNASLISLITRVPNPTMIVWKRGVYWFYEISRTYPRTVFKEQFSSYWDETKINEEE
jgi:hypothetical protein